MLDTRSAKLPADLVEMLAALARHDPTTNVAEIVDPILRRPVEKLFDRLPEADKAYARERIARLAQPQPAAPSAK